MASPPVPRQLYKPGDRISETGMYRALHVGINCSWPKATLEADNVFPACPTCGSSIRYTLGRASAVTVDEAADVENSSRPL